MPNGFLHALHQLWALGVIEVNGIISALSAYGYELSYIDKQGIKVENENEKFEFRYGRN
jgi:hypothetical protein